MQTDVLGTTDGMEERARRMGWVPQESFKGSPDRWVDAETFVRMAEESLPHAKGTIKKLEDQLTKLQREMADFVKFSRTAEERAYKKALEELRVRQRTAVESGDVEAFDKVSEDLDKLIQEHPAVTGQPPKGTTAVTGSAEYDTWLATDPGAFERWKSENRWYSEDPEMFAYAEQADRFLYQKYGLKVSQVDRLNEITEIVKKRFPEYWGGTRRSAASSVEPGGVGPSHQRGRSYMDLPTEAREVCDRWTGKDGKGKTGSIPGLTREDYLKSYWEK